jgi:excisionase family DNA binding protein
MKKVLFSFAFALLAIFSFGQTVHKGSLLGLHTAGTPVANPFEKINADLNEVKMMLGVLLENQNKPVEKSDLIDLDEACELLKLSRSSIYKMTAKNEIPFIKRNGSNKLLFSRSRLDAWINESLINQTSATNLVDEYLHKKIRVRKEQNN